MDTENTRRIALALSQETFDDLLQLARRQGVELNDVLTAAVHSYLAQDAAFLHAGSAALSHYRQTGLHVTNEEIGAWIAELEAGNDDAEPPVCHT